jgi:hypothetical protein
MKHWRPTLSPTQLVTLPANGKDVCFTLKHPVVSNEAASSRRRSDPRPTPRA